MKCKNRNHWARSAWTQLAIQVAGVFSGFLLSLWAAVTISPHLSIEHGFFISFLFALLIFSNLWTYISQRLFALVQNIFPSIKFYRPGKDAMLWLQQAIVGGIIVAFILFLLGKTYSYIGQMVGSFFKHGV